MVDDVVSLDRPAIFAASKDRPILFTALAWTEVLLTRDKSDFADMLGGTFYELSVLHLTISSDANAQWAGYTRRSDHRLADAWFIACSCSAHVAGEIRPA